MFNGESPKRQEPTWNQCKCCPYGGFIVGSNVAREPGRKWFSKSPRVKRLPQLRGSAKIGFAEKVEGGRKFEESGLSGVAQDAQGA